MKDRIIAFLSDIDEALKGPANGRMLDIYHIGRSAILWEYDYGETTQDVDIFRPIGGEDLVKQALRLFGRDTAEARKHGLYLEVVEIGLPPAPAGFDRRASLVPEHWTVLRLFHLDPHDLAATKMRRFSPKDRADIRQLCDRGILDPSKLETVLEAAFRFVHEKDGDPYRDDTFANLRLVQKYLRGESTEF